MFFARRVEGEKDHTERERERVVKHALFGGGGSDRLSRVGDDNKLERWPKGAKSQRAKSIARSRT